MIDLVYRLRTLDHAEVPALLTEAADEIEAMRAALKVLIAFAEDHGDDDAGAYRVLLKSSVCKTGEPDV